MAVEIGIPYEILGADGSRVVLGNGPAATADPDWVGFLSPDDGISGLIDGGDQRGGGGNRPGTPGGYDVPTLAARRTGAIAGMIGAYEQAAIVSFCSRLARATRTDTSDGILKWTPTGAAQPRMIRFRRRSSPAYKGRRPKTFSMALETRDAYAVSTVESSFVINPSDAPGELGVPDPVTDPMTSALTSIVAGVAINNGDAPAWPRFRIDGPVINPTIVNYSTGQSLALTNGVNLAAGQWLDVVPEFGIILLNGSLPRYRFLTVAASTYWRLAPGANTIRLLAADYSGTPLLTTYWRDSWE